MSHLILVVEDDEGVAEMIERSLRRAGHQVMVALHSVDALQMAREHKPSLLILDIIMPGMTGLDICRLMRSSPELEQIPILFLTARGEVNDRLEGFDAGGDDYLSKPFDVRELQARVSALLRRTQPQEKGSVERLYVGDLALDCQTYELRTRRGPVILTPVEFRILRVLMSKPRQVFSARELLQQVWGYPPGTGTPDLVRVHIKNIREKIEPVPGQPTYLRNVRRRGYMITGE